MEYTCKSTASGKACSILLTDFQIVHDSAGHTIKIPYSEVALVRLVRKSKKHFRLYLYPVRKSHLVLSNIYYLSLTDSEDRSRQYVTFVRILHMHLASQSKSLFATGIAFTDLFRKFVGSAAISFLLSFLADYFFPGNFNPGFIGLCLFVVSVIAIFFAVGDQWPRYYSPDNIPLKFLP